MMPISRSASASWGRPSAPVVAQEVAPVFRGEESAEFVVGDGWQVERHELQGAEAEYERQHPQPQASTTSSIRYGRSQPPSTTVLLLVEFCPKSDQRAVRGRL